MITILKQPTPLPARLRLTNFLIQMCKGLTKNSVNNNMLF